MITTLRSASRFLVQASSELTLTHVVCIPAMPECVHQGRPSKSEGELAKTCQFYMHLGNGDALSLI